MSHTVRRVALTDGAELEIDVHGEGGAIVLLHGFTGDASTMLELTERLRTTHRVIVPNLIGHGGSTGPPDRYGVDAMAEQVLEALAVLDVPAPYDVVGYSMGGRVGLTIACRFPAQVASLSLIGASAGLATAAERADRVAADDALAESILTDGLEVFVDRWMANPLFATQSRLGREFLAAARAQRLRNQPAELARSLRGAGTGTMRPLHDVLVRCALPVGLVVGADDEKFRVIAGELREALPDAEVTTVDRAGHAAHLEQPEAVAAAIRATMGRGSVRVVSTSLPLRGAHTTGRGTTVRRESLLLGIRADGHTGWGEASPLPGWSENDLATARAALPAASDLRAATTAWDATAKWRDSTTGLAARAAVAGAALDLDARREGMPLWRYLGSWHRALHDTVGLDTIAVNALVSSPDPAVVASEVGDCVASGIETIKLKVGAVDPAADRARLVAARAAGPAAEIRIDANGAWDHDTAIAFLTFAATLGVVLCEEPVRGIQAIAAVGREASVPVAVDESVRTPADLSAVADHVEGLAALVVKPQALGGPDLAIDAIVAARHVGLDVIVTSMIDSAVGLGHAAHVAAACGLESAHGLATASLLAADVAPGLVVARGRIEMPTAPGLGIGLVSPAAAGAS